MSNGPLPTRLVFLSDLPSIEIGSKVRFLGCVTKYTPSTGFLTLQHAFPASSAGITVAQVQLQLLLETLKREDTEVGAWVNVMGYVEGIVHEDSKAKDKAYGVESKGITKVEVRAIMLWSAEAIKIGQYESALAERLAVEKNKG